MLLNSKRYMDLIKNEKGYALVLVTLGMTVIMAVSALVIDVGLMFTNKIMVANAADAAVLAGVQALPADTFRLKPWPEYAARTGWMTWRLISLQIIGPLKWLPKRP